MMKDIRTLAAMKKRELNAQEDLVKRIEELNRENSRLKSLLLTDELTSLYNKHFFSVQLEVETARARRTGQTCTLMMMDLDDFKSINDTFGHDVGDRILTRIGAVILRNIRPTDFACRFGGDEFAIIMPAAQLIDGIGVAKRIQSSLMSKESGQHPGIGKPLSGSFGLAVYESFSELSVDDFFKQADLKMYEAKRAGKNSICYDHSRMPEKSAVSRTERDALSQIITNID
ncbi:GGDEF domain-containing protein [bacterium]|nr:MAG: GGDEF domain-containing protein [bacterium]